VEKYKPYYHFTPGRNWMNDPNGLVFYKGMYHMFYQYHPYGTTWGPMHWGHAVSSDLVHWDHWPVALEPDEHGMIFSGSAIVDWNDTSGFFQGKTGMVAIFTQHGTDPETGGIRECQSIAYSTDDGKTWLKYTGNPVLANEQHTDFRDPKVFWHHESQQWIMILASGQTVSIYHSSNLIDWKFASEFGQGEGCHEGVWECPDLFPLPVDNDETRMKWVMFVSVGNTPGSQEGSRTQYFIGDFDGKMFVNDGPSDKVRWLDYGRDNYAGVSWSDVPAEDGRRIYIGWMNNWKYANVTPTDGWRGVMTVPRELGLTSINDGINDKIILIQKPIRELERLRVPILSLQETTMEEAQRNLSLLKMECFEIVADIGWEAKGEFGFKVRSSAVHETIVGYSSDSGELFVDRTKSGNVSFHPDFAGRHRAALHSGNCRLKLRIHVDRSSIEVFANDGIVAMTDLIYPNEEDNGIEIYASGGGIRIHSLELFGLRSLNATSIFQSH